MPRGELDGGGRRVRQVTAAISRSGPPGEPGAARAGTGPALIRAAAAGDLAAFEQIVAPDQQPVWRFLRRLLGDAATAEDVAQETFLRVYRRLPDLRVPQAKFSTWVFQIARNAGLDELRSRQRATTGVRRAAPAGADPRCRDAAGPRSRRPWPILPVDLREALVLVEVSGCATRGGPCSACRSARSRAGCSAPRWRMHGLGRTGLRGQEAGDEV